MTVPLDAIRAIHNAFRKDLAAIDAAANKAAGGFGSLGLILKRHTFFNEVLSGTPVEKRKTCSRRWKALPR